MQAAELIRTSFFMPRAQRERLQAITDETGSPLSFQIRRALDIYLATNPAAARSHTPARDDTGWEDRQ